MKQYIISLIILLAVVSIATAGVLTTTNARITKAEDLILKANGFDTSNCVPEKINDDVYKIQCGSSSGLCTLNQSTTISKAQEQCLKEWAKRFADVQIEKEKGLLIVEVEK